MKFILSFSLSRLYHKTRSSKKFKGSRNMIYRYVNTPICRVFPTQTFYNKTCEDDASDDTSISSSHNVYFNGC